MGYYTKKVLYIGIKNKFCAICERSKSKEEVRPHSCSKNWDHSSTSMEAAITVDGFLTSEETYGVRYAKLVADGDSSVYKKILEARPYKNLTVEKIECRNHLLRNYCTKLREIATTSDGGRYPPYLRKIIGDKILKLRAGVTKAIEYRKAQKNSVVLNAEELRKDILNGLHHTFGDHSCCQERGYFCSGQNKVNEINMVPELLKTGLFQKITVVVKQLSLNSRSLLYDVDTNAVEQFNSIVAKHIGGKRINFSQANSYKARCTAAVLQHNTGRAHYVLHKSMYSKSPGTFCKKIQTRRQKKVADEKERRRLKPKCKKSLFQKKLAVIKIMAREPNVQT